jgi:hypothetical protein
MRRSIFAVSVCSLALAASTLIAGDSAKSPEEFFKSKGLIKTGFMLIVPEEQALHDAVNALRTAKGKLATAAAKIRNADAQIKTAVANLKTMEAELHDTNVRMANGQNDNQTIGRHNLLIDQIKDQAQKISDLIDGKEKLLVSRSDYITAALDASDKADAAVHAYDGPHADKELAAFIDKYNLTAKPKVKLGPSAYCNEDLALVKQCKADVTSGSIPITTEGGVPNVQVLLNGSFTQTMIWDSGATMVSLSSKTARALDLHPTDSDPVVEMTIADGRTVKARIMTLDSIRIGSFTVEHLPCIVPPNGTQGADPLGNDFQHHFQFKLDINAATLQLTPLDPQTASAKAPSKLAAQPALEPAPPVSAPAKAVSVKFASDVTTIGIIEPGSKIFNNRKYTFGDVPPELQGLSYTRRGLNQSADVTIDIPAHATVYLIIDSDKGANGKRKGVRELNQSLIDSDWRRLDDVKETGMQSTNAIYTQDFATAQQVTIPGAGNGILVAAKNLRLDTDDTTSTPPADPPAKTESSNPLDRFAGVWFLPKNKVEYTLNPDGTASSHDGNTGTWTVNDSGTIINIKWAKGGWSEVFRLSHGTWTKYTYKDDDLRATDEITPP